MPRTLYQKLHGNPSCVGMSIVVMKDLGVEDKPWTEVLQNLKERYPIWPLLMEDVWRSLVVQTKSPHHYTPSS